MDNTARRYRLLDNFTTCDDNLKECKGLPYTGLEIVFFNKSTLNLTGWQTLDIYQNLSLTNIYNVKINQKIEDNIFKLPKMN